MSRLKNQPESKNFVDLTAINPYIDYLMRILTSPTTSRQSTDYRQDSDPSTKKYPQLNPGHDDPHMLYAKDAKMDHKEYINNWLINDFLMKVNKQSQPKGDPIYDGLQDGTFPSR